MLSGVEVLCESLLFDHSLLHEFFLLFLAEGLPVEPLVFILDFLRELLDHLILSEVNLGALFL